MCLDEGGKCAALHHLRQTGVCQVHRAVAENYGCGDTPCYGRRYAYVAIFNVGGVFSTFLATTAVLGLQEGMVAGRRFDAGCASDDGYVNTAIVAGEAVPQRVRARPCTPAATPGQCWVQTCGTVDCAPCLARTVAIGTSSLEALVAIL